MIGESGGLEYLSIVSKVIFWSGYIGAAVLSLVAWCDCMAVFGFGVYGVFYLGRHH